MSRIRPAETETAIARRVEVRAPGRLHMGFLDLNGGLGRRFGSIGLALEAPSTVLRLRAAATTSAQGPDAERAEAYAGRILRKLGISGGVEIEVAEAIPSHAGLGSGTQMCLALIDGIGRLFDAPLNLERTAVDLGRGARSGVGIGAFTRGGFLVDGGRGRIRGVPPLVARVAFPGDWRLLLVLERGRAGVHGPAEREAFSRLPTFAASVSERLCRLTLMQMLPALAESDIEGFGKAVGEVQRCVGAHFAAVQGGAYSSSRVARIMAGLAEAGAVCVGQSSWGPTGFALFRSEADARRALKGFPEQWAGPETFEYRLCAARNAPADVVVESGETALKIVESGVS